MTTITRPTSILLVSRTSRALAKPAASLSMPSTTARAHFGLFRAVAVAVKRPTRTSRSLDNRPPPPFPRATPPSKAKLFAHFPHSG